jgi:hypothetical protein
MCFVPLALAVGSAVAGAYGRYQQASAEQAAAKYNARVAEVQAANARRRGEEEAMRVQRAARKIAGTQRTAYAARGLDIGYGTAGDVVDETNFFGVADAATARENAAREATGFASQASMFRTEAKNTSPLAAAGISLIGRAPLVADRWTQYRTKPKRDKR